MDDHQLEVCLALDKYVRTCRVPEDISDAINLGPLDSTYPPLDISIFPSLLDEELATSLRGKEQSSTFCVVVVSIVFVLLAVSATSLRYQRDS